MNQQITPKAINFKELVNNSNTTLSLNIQTKIVDKLNDEFTNDEQQWYIANLYMYMNYHPTNDFPINLEHVFKMIGFANKGNAMKTIKSNFVEDEDYKIIIFRTEKNKSIQETRGRKEETIMLNVDTFKNLCMIAKTEKGKEIRKYYVKLETIYNDIIKEEIDEQQKHLEEQNQKLQQQTNEIQERDKKIKLLEHKPQTYGFGLTKTGYIYLINDLSKPGHYKIGMASNTKNRLRNLNTSSSEKSLRLYFEIDTYDAESVERTIHFILVPFNITGRREWFYFSDEDQVQYAIAIMKNVKNFFDQYHFTSHKHFLETIVQKVTVTSKQGSPCRAEALLRRRSHQQHDDGDDRDGDRDGGDQGDEVNVDGGDENERNNIVANTYDDNLNNIDITETNVFKLTGQRLKNKTGNYKGVFWTTEKAKWRAALKHDYKEVFLGYFDTELEGAKVYNDYALYLNQTKNTNYSLNDILNYTTTPRDIIAENAAKVNNSKTSLYNGVCYDTRRNYYAVSIKYKGKSYHLGRSNDQLECAKLYNQQALYFNNTYNTNYVLNDIPNYITLPINVHERLLKNKISNKTSKYYGVTFSKQAQKYKALLVYNKKQIHLGTFSNELDAAEAYNKRASELNENTKCKYKLNTIT
jgi:phage anti-repressor protein